MWKIFKLLLLLCSIFCYEEEKSESSTLIELSKKIDKNHFNQLSKPLPPDRLKKTFISTSISARKKATTKISSYINFLGLLLPKRAIFLNYQFDLLLFISKIWKASWLSVKVNKVKGEDTPKKYEIFINYSLNESAYQASTFWPWNPVRFDWDAVTYFFILNSSCKVENYLWNALISFFYCCSTCAWTNASNEKRGK